MSENTRRSRTSVVTVVINDKSQGSVARHFRRGEIFNSHVFTNLVLSLPVHFFLNLYILAKLQARRCIVSHFVRVATTLLKDEELR